MIKEAQSLYFFAETDGAIHVRDGLRSDHRYPMPWAMIYNPGGMLSTTVLKRACSARH